MLPGKHARNPLDGVYLRYVHGSGPRLCCGGMACKSASPAPGSKHDVMAAFLGAFDTG
jgi:hypothetical protein